MQGFARDDGYDGESGQVALPLIVTVLAVMLGLGLIAHWGAAAIGSARAQSVADATALAVAMNGSAGLSVGQDVDSVTVFGGSGRALASVRIGGQEASAAAVAQTTAAVRRFGLAPSLVAALARAEALLGSPVLISSGYRSPADQQRLWDMRADNPYPVARPGTSLHERGLAIDVQLSQVGDLAVVAAQAGLCHPLPEADPVHFVVCPIPD